MTEKLYTCNLCRVKRLQLSSDDVPQDIFAIRWTHNGIELVAPWEHDTHICSQCISSIRFAKKPTGV